MTALSTIRIRRMRRRNKCISFASVTGLILLQTTMFVPTSARLSSVLSYSTMMGLAAQSSRWKHAMEGELTQLAKKSAEAAAWQESAEADEAASEKFAKKALEEQEEAALLEKEGESLVAKGEADQVKAATTEEEAGGFSAQAAETEGQSTALVAEAATEEALAEGDIAKATADTALAAEDSVTAEADEAGAAICQFIPLIDVVCDVVGGIAAVGLETQAVRSAALAAEEYAAAAAAQVEVDSTTAEATELRVAAVEEGEKAGALQSKAGTLEVQADEELAEGQADEVAAEEQLRHSVVDEGAAGEEEVKAGTEEDSSANAWSESMQHGANACGKAIMMSLASVAALLFWTIRIAGPVLKTGVSGLWKLAKSATGKAESSSSISNTPTTFEILYASSHIFHHGLLFVLFFGLWGDALLQLRSLSSIAAMGGLVLGFSSSLAAAQVVMLHSVPKACHHDGDLSSSLWFGLREFVRWMLVLCPLVVMEILLVWVNIGNWVFVPIVVQGAQLWWLWVVLAVSIATHFCWFVVKASGAGEAAEHNKNNTHSGVNHDEPSVQCLLRQTNGQDGFTDYGARDVDLDAETEFFDAEEDEWISIEGSTEGSLLHEYEYRFNIISTSQNATLQDHEKWFPTLVLEDFARLRLVLMFELLMASIMLALLRQSTPALQALWPASKSILVAAYPHWHLMGALAVVVAVMVLVCACF